MNIYFISGLGADERMFEKLKLPEQFRIIHIKWKEPQKNETLEHYAFRLAEEIDRTSPFILVGMSFGGMLASIISQKFHPAKTILISSAASSKEIPWYFKLAGILQIDRLVPAAVFKMPSFFTYYIFGASSPGTRKLLSQILKNTDKKFLKWAIRSILTWNMKNAPKNYFHVHGTEDKILPLRFSSPHHIIKKGSHLMIYDMADEVSKIITGHILPEGLPKR